MMPNATASKVATQFIRDFTKFLHDREALQELFVAWHFEMLEDQHRESGSELSLDEWLTDVMAYRFDSYPWPYRSMTQYDDKRVWKIVFNDDGNVLNQNGRGQFVAGFNRLLEQKGMQARLSDNTVQMYFTDVSRWEKPTY